MGGPTSESKTRKPLHHGKVVIPLDRVQALPANIYTSIYDDHMRGLMRDY